MRRKVIVIGHFGENKNLINGQTVKTKLIYKNIKKIHSSVEYIDTHNFRKKKIKSLLSTLIKSKNYKNIIMMPAQNGVKVFSIILVLLKYMFGNTIHYIVIGGWLPTILKKNKLLSEVLCKFDYIYVETNTMKKNLEKLGFENIVILKNFKNLKVLNSPIIETSMEEPKELCMFSRVTQNKGIVDAINIVNNINESRKRNICKLDIYGPIDEEFREEFLLLLKNQKNIVYKGEVNFENSVETIKRYYMLLFPTKYFTEGIPGTIIDAYAAGVPVLASR